MMGVVFLLTCIIPSSNFSKTGVGVTRTISRQRNSPSVHSQVMAPATVDDTLTGT